MARFLILMRPTKPIPEKANIAKVRSQLKELQDEGRAEVYQIVEDDGYGFAVFIDVADHDELMRILFRNPLGRWGEYQVFPLGTLEGEHEAMYQAGILK